MDYIFYIRMIFKKVIYIDFAFTLEFVIFLFFSIYSIFSEIFSFIFISSLHCLNPNSTFILLFEICIVNFRNYICIIILSMYL